MALAPPELPRSRRCALVGLSRSRYFELLRVAPSEVDAEETALRQRLEALCLGFPGYGYRRVAAQLRREDRHVNPERVYR